MRKRYPAAPAEAILVDGQETRLVPELDEDLRVVGLAWHAAPALPAFRAVFCRHGRVHATQDGHRSLCGHGIRNRFWILAGGLWCGEGVVRCKHCENHLARVLGEKTMRRK